MIYRDPKTGEQIIEPFYVEEKMDLNREEYREMEEEMDEQ
jgi:hypothetical protein